MEVDTRLGTHPLLLTQSLHDFLYTVANKADFSAA